MSGFSNPIVGGAETLIRSAIKSFGYIAGVFGWRIAKDGSAEFNDVTVRGSFIATSPSGANVQVFATAGGAEIDFQPPDHAGLTFSPGSLTATSAATGTDLIIRGPGESSPTNVNGGAIFLGADNTIPASQATIVADQIVFSGTVTYNPYTKDSGRGFVHSGGTNVASGAIGPTETKIFDVASFTYRANRAYRVETSGRFAVSVASNTPSFRLRKDDGSLPPTGTQLVIGSTSAVTTLNHSIVCNGVFTVGINDVTTQLELTGLGSAGFNVSTSGTPALTVSIYDIGAASDHSLDPVLT
jgi:hypothetical protein